MLKLPRLYADADDYDTIVIDTSEPFSAREVTRQFEFTAVRPPAIPARYRWAVLAGFLAGAPTDVIADSLAEGIRWTIGEARFAPLLSSVWLSPASMGGGSLGYYAGWAGGGGLRAGEN